MGPDLSADHQAEVDGLLAEYRRSREQLAAVQQELAAIRVTASTEDGGITVTVGPQGTLTNLVITDAAHQRYRAAELAAIVVRLATAAAAQASERAARTLTPVLPADSDPAAVLRGTADLSDAEIAPKKPPPSEESFEDVPTWMDTRDGRPPS
ncbi:DNA-binding protein YbaB [Herbihabitans rhizosphaerae]|uniref:DNA-binding protein YbaB n=1 Tax=Herbihabitans rhizosphaerae TaxID=1872711 RepID=A0A4Q7KH55_9PSEU|nr:YbaB/EbfC family nucleoid-associated protein [Herbihabitans rhizosphaerae]RZS33864.1 DNA-binding protein YbaB [Herbihabitans rhizosphaerae]